MSTSPSLRLSLRRKRSTRYSENSSSPAIKKSSPTLPEAKKEPPSTPKSHRSRRPNNKLSRSGSRSSPRISQAKSTDKNDNEEEDLQTPVSTKWTLPSGDQLRQPSPDMPFLSSQLCGTQECEVVWDCDSPGFTKEDLKRMHRGGEPEVQDRPLPVPQLPHRQLFPFTRSRASRPLSSGNTNAQLNDLLDLLSSKELAGKKNKEKEEDPNNHNKTLQHILPVKDTLSEDSSSSESPAVLEPLSEASSQPFEVPGVSGPKEGDQTLPCDIDDSLWGDDLNLGICDINESVLTEYSSNRTSSVDISAANKAADGSKLPSATADLSSASIDIFDDDLFSDSVILSTQAVEEAMTQKETKDNTSDMNYSCVNSAKKTQHHSKSTLYKDGHQHQEKDSDINNIVKNINRNCNKSEVSSHDMVSNNFSTSNRITLSVNMKQKSSNLDSSLQRQVRQSFKFRPSPKSEGKSTPSLVTERNNQSLVSVTENQSIFRGREVRGELRKTDSIPALGTEKSSMQNLSASNLMSNRLTRAPPSLDSLNTQMTKAPMVRKSLFKNNNAKSEEAKQRSSIPAARGPLLRSQSSGDTRITASSTVGRRSNSSMELDTSQDLEDDEFFKSLLSMLPEEEGGFSANSGVPLSPIKPENLFTEFQKGVRPSSSDMRHITENRVNTRESRFIKKEPCIVPPQKYNAIPPQNLKTGTRNQSNVSAHNLHNIPSQNLRSIPSQNLRNNSSQRITNIPSQNLHSIPSKKISNIPSHNLRSTPSQNLTNVSSRNQCNIPSKNFHKVSHQNLTNGTSQNAHSVLSESLPKAPPPKFVNRSVHTALERQIKQGIKMPQVDQSGKQLASLVQEVRPRGADCPPVRTKSLDANKTRAGDDGQQQTSDTFDDGLFEDDVLSLIDEVESQFGSQNAPSEPSPSPQSSQPQQVKCTQDEIAQKKAAALRRREERRRQQCR